MVKLDSFQLELTTQWRGNEVSYLLAWQSPDSFRVLYPNLEYREGGQQPVIVDKGVLEAVAIEDAVYARHCAAVGQGCQPWHEGPRNNVYVPVVLPELEPFWTIELLGLMSDVQIVGQGDVDGVACTRIRGRANIMQAMIQSWRRAEETRGRIDWGEECSSATREAVGETQEEECRQTTEYIGMAEQRLSESPPSMDVLIERDDALLRRIEFSSLTGPPAEGSFTFSRFNEVTITPPE
jgi:hypothetical protein